MILSSRQPVTLIGGGGFIGRYVAQALLKAGARVRLAEAELLDAALVEGLERAEDTILNGSDERLFGRRLADFFTGRDPRGGNVVTTLTLLDAMLAAGGRLAGRSSAPDWWTLASPDNHGIDIAAWGDVAGGPDDE